MGKTFKIEFDREGCIGSAACEAACNKNWELDDTDGKANVLKTQIDESELKCNKDAAKSCPVNVIKIFDEETGDQVA